MDAKELTQLKEVVGSPPEGGVVGSRRRVADWFARVALLLQWDIVDSPLGPLFLAARSALTQIKALGPWSADIYLLRTLRRPDIWPSGDLVLAVAVQRICCQPDSVQRTTRMDSSERTAVPTVRFDSYSGFSRCEFRAIRLQVGEVTVAHR